MSRAKNILIALDQLINAVCGGWPDETLSSRAWRWDVKGKRTWPRRLIDALFFFDSRHCLKSYESERLGRQLPPEARPEL
jgi:hypothetical protein